MKAPFFLFLTLFLSSSFAIQKELGTLFIELIEKDKFEGQKAIAIMPFKVDENIPADAGRTISEFAVVNFHSSGRYKIVERQEFSKMMAELELAQSDLVAEEIQIKLGKLLVADRMLVGSVSESFGKRMITARILSVETGEVLSTATTTVGPAAMDDFMKELLGEKGQVSAAILRSAIVPGWGQFYTSHPIRGSISLVAGLGTLGYTIYQYLTAWNSAIEKEDFGNYNYDQLNQGSGEAKKRINDISVACNEQTSVSYEACKRAGADEIDEEIKGLKEAYEDDLLLANIMVGVTAGVWVLNMVDATFAGMSAKKKFDLYFSSTPKKPFDLRLAWRF
ncbi:MAG: hypothetical protein HQK83_07430 [Fibrobacteria bacterium]|nr:hypothetical protein [Fibrobacteria bacterium]